MKGEKKKNNVAKNLKTKRMPRPHKICFSLNDDEKKLLTTYIQCHKIENRSAFVREVVMKQLWDKMEKLQLSLFDDCSII